MSTYPSAYKAGAQRSPLCNEVARQHQGAEAPQVWIPHANSLVAAVLQCRGNVNNAAVMKQCRGNASSMDLGCDIAGHIRGVCIPEGRRVGQRVTDQWKESGHYP